jgi:hypothetical protein
MKRIILKLYLGPQFQFDTRMTSMRIGSKGFCRWCMTPRINGLISVSSFQGTQQSRCDLPLHVRAETDTASETFQYLEFWTKDKVQNPSNSEYQWEARHCRTPQEIQLGEFQHQCHMRLEVARGHILARYLSSRGWILVQEGEFLKRLS